MEKLSELTITDVKELVGGRKAAVSSTEGNVMSVNMADAIVIADPDAGLDGRITLLEPNTGCKIELDSDELIESIFGNENTIVITFSNGMGELNIEFEREILIHPWDEELIHKGPAYEDFVSREDFINRTGVFVTPIHFEFIYGGFKKANVSADEFLDNYKEKYATHIQEVPLSGTFRYELMDDNVIPIGLYEENYDPNIWEIINSLVMSYEAEYKSNRDFVEKLKTVLENKAKNT